MTANWLSPAIAGVAAALSLVNVILISRLSSRTEHRKWLRDERVQAAMAVKLEVSRLRARHSRPNDRQETSPDRESQYDFSDINAAMARLDIVGSNEVVVEVQQLRAQLRDFVRSVSEDKNAWRQKREAVDRTVDRIVALIRRDVL
ncbi:hypothetical protein ACSNN7_04445 [Micromonospora sp. URMC 105]|uniref:hypothetical protein n=1 Tax=Micromonospora sp. URMC 105 TaxID=3423413 RepID=UPI003F1B6552